VQCLIWNEQIYIYIYIYIYIEREREVATVRAALKNKTKKILKMNKAVLTPMFSFGFEIWAKKERQYLKGFSLLHKVIKIFPNGVFCSALRLVTCAYIIWFAIYDIHKKSIYGFKYNLLWVNMTENQNCLENLVKSPMRNSTREICYRFGHWYWTRDRHTERNKRKTDRNGFHIMRPLSLCEGSLINAK
jgi:hypothetical protein